VRLLEVGKARDETQGSGPRANEMSHGAVWLYVIEMSQVSRAKAY